MNEHEEKPNCKSMEQLQLKAIKKVKKRIEKLF